MNLKKGLTLLAIFLLLASPLIALCHIKAVHADAENWLDGWYGYRIPFTIDHSNIASNQTDFIFMVYVSNSSGTGSDDLTPVFDELGDDCLKIAITLADGQTQCKVEVDYWNGTEEEAWIFCKTPSISSLEDTIFYLYCDSLHDDNIEYVGTSHYGTLMSDIWSDYTWVSHMSDQNLAVEEIENALDGLPNNFAWQGVGTDGSYWYLSCSLNTAGGEQNGLRKYDISNSSLVLENDMAYPTDYLFSDCEVINGSLYVVARDNGNKGGGLTDDNIVLIYDKDTFELVDTIDITQGDYYFAEAVSDHDGEFFVMYGGGYGAGNRKCSVARYTENWEFEEMYDLFMIADHCYGYQAIVWVGDYFYTDVHEGSFTSGYSQGTLDCYHWDGETFSMTSRYQHIIDTGAYNVGQGFTYLGGYFYFAGRYSNRVIKCQLGTTDSTSHIIEDTYTYTTNKTADNPTMVSGSVSKAQDFSSDRIDMDENPNPSGLSGFNYGTASALINVDNFLTVDDGKNTIFWTCTGWFLEVRGDAPNVGKVAFYLWATSNPGYHFSSATLDTGTDYMVTLTYDGSAARLYINGVSDINVSNSGDVGFASPTYASLGCEHLTAQDIDMQYRFLDGKISDFTLTPTVKDSAWVYTEYLSKTDALIDYDNIEECESPLCVVDISISSPTVISAYTSDVSYSFSNIGNETRVSWQVQVYYANGTAFWESNDTSTSGAITGLVGGNYTFAVYGIGAHSANAYSEVEFQYDVYTLTATINEPDATNYDAHSVPWDVEPSGNDTSTSWQIQVYNSSTPIWGENSTDTSGTIGELFTGTYTFAALVTGGHLSDYAEVEFSIGAPDTYVTSISIVAPENTTYSTPSVGWAVTNTGNETGVAYQIMVYSYGTPIWGRNETTVRGTITGLTNGTYTFVISGVGDHSAYDYQTVIFSVGTPDTYIMTIGIVAPTNTAYAVTRNVGYKVINTGNETGTLWQIQVYDFEGFPVFASNFTNVFGTLPDLVNGTYTLAVYAIGDHFEDDYATVVFRVAVPDTYTISITMTAPENTTYTETKNIIYSVGVTGNDTSPVYQINAYLDGNPIGDNLTASSGSFADLENGTYTFAVSVICDAGSMDYKTVVFTVAFPDTYILTIIVNEPILNKTYATTYVEYSITMGGNATQVGLQIQVFSSAGGAMMLSNQTTASGVVLNLLNDDYTFVATALGNALTYDYKEVPFTIAAPFGDSGGVDLWFLATLTIIFSVVMLIIVRKKSRDGKNDDAK